MSARTALALLMMTLVAAGLSGCSKKPPPKPDATKVSGTWTEIPETAAAGGTRNNRRPQSAPRPYLRQITFNDDKTFKMVLTDQSGKPLAGNKLVDGTWEFQEGSLNFSVKTNTLDAAMQNWKPVSSSGVVGFYNQDKTGFDERLIVSHEDAPVTYKRGTGG